MKNIGKILSLMLIASCAMMFAINAAPVKFNISCSDRVIIESESFLRFSGYKTVFLQKNILEASADSMAPIKVHIIHLNSDDSSQSEGVVCYITTSDTTAFDALSKDLNTFSALYQVPIEIIRTR